MLVNLWDNTFRHDVGSVAGKPPKTIEWTRDHLQWDGVTVFVDDCIHPETVQRVQSTYKVGWLHEPRCFRPANYENVDWWGLDLVLTYHAPYLLHPKARLLPWASVWIPRDRWGIKPKTKLCSMLYGAKMDTVQHRMRPQIADAIRGSGKVDFFGREGEPVGYGWQTKEKVLADYAFTVIVTNCYEPNYWDEWLDDAFALGTIPILWGCPNIGEYFNAQGILTFEGVQGAVSTVERLSMDLYGQMKESAADNLERIGRYEITDDLLADVLRAEHLV